MNPSYIITQQLPANLHFTSHFQSRHLKSQITHSMFHTNTLFFMSVTTQTQEPSQLQPGSSTSKPGSKKRTRQNDTPFRGVRKRRWGSYVSEIRLPGEKTRIWLGSFGSAEKAARAYDSAAFYLKGNLATLNFPASAGALPRPESCSRKDIQVAAAKAAALVEMGDRIESECSGSGGEPDCGDWWERETTASDEVKVAPLPSPPRFDSDIGELYCWMDDDNFLLGSCLEL